MDCVTTEQAFLPPSARPSDEQWRSALNTKVGPEAELAKQRQSNIRDILLSRLVPNYDTQRYDMADLDEKFIDLDLERADATSDDVGDNDLESEEEEALGIDEDVAELIYEGQKSDAVQELRSSQPDLSLAEAKDIVEKATEALRSMRPEKFL
jgi:hypothetical protein